MHEAQSSITALKQLILDSVAVNDDIINDECDKLLKLADHEDKQSRAFAYVWKADHAFYCESDIHKMRDYLQSADHLIDRRAPNITLKKYYSLWSIFYESFYDLQKCLENNLQALTVATQLDNKREMAICYGNIGNLFGHINGLDEALIYSKKAIDLLYQFPDDNQKVICLTLYNMGEVCFKQKQSRELKKIIDEMIKLDLPKDFQIYIDVSFASYYELLSEYELVKAYLDKLDKQGAFQHPNRVFAFEFIMRGIRATIHFKDEVYASRLLTNLKKLVNQDENEYLLEYWKQKILFDKTFHHQDHLQQDYRHYFKIYQESQKQMQVMRSEGMRARLKINDVTIEQLSTKRQVQDLEKEANRDELTQIYNRRYLNLRQNEILRDRNTQSIGFVIVDIDYFKEYNDEYGHLAGDKVLCTVADCMVQAIDHNMAACRYGGDEFTCLCWNCDELELLEYVKRLQESMRDKAIPHTMSHCAPIVTLSIGFGVQKRPMKQRSFTLFEEVDTALYMAKKKGRNHAVSITMKEVSGDGSAVSECI